MDAHLLRDCFNCKSHHVNVDRQVVGANESTGKRKGKQMHEGKDYYEKPAVSVFVFTKIRHGDVIYITGVVTLM